MNKEHFDIIKEYRRKKNIIEDIKSSLNHLNKEKEFWFNKKENLKKELSTLVIKIKEYKSQRDRSNFSIGYFKNQRDKHNSEVKELIKDLKELNEEKNKIISKYNSSLNPIKIYEKINELERKVEVEAEFDTNYKKERKVMDQIRKLKKIYGESKEITVIMEKIRILSEQIKNSKQKADEFHKKIIQSINDKPYSNFIRIAKQINLIRKEQEDAFAKFIDLKNKFTQLNNILKLNINELDYIRNKLKKNNLISHLDKEEIMKELLHEKTKNVEEKIRKGKKLTTEDLLTFQAKK